MTRYKNYGIYIDQGIKITLGITAQWHVKVQIVRAVCDLDVDSTYPKAVYGLKGLTVRQIKCYVSWVQYDVSQYGFYLLCPILTYKRISLMYERN